MARGCRFGKVDFVTTNKQLFALYIDWLDLIVMNSNLTITNV